MDKDLIFMLDLKGKEYIKVGVKGAGKTTALNAFIDAFYPKKPKVLDMVNKGKSFKEINSTYKNFSEKSNFYNNKILIEEPKEIIIKS